MPRTEDHARSRRERPRGRSAESPTEIPPKGWKDIALRIKDQFAEDHVSLTAAGVAFFGFVAMVPLLIASVSIYGLFADADQVTALVDRLGPSVPDEVRSLLRQQLTSVVEASPGALGFGAVVGLASALWSGSSGFANLIEAMNIAYDEDDGRSFWARRLLALAMTIVAIVALAVVASFESVLGQADLGAASLPVRFATWAILALLAVVALAMLYRFGPDRRQPQWQWVSWGAAFSVLGLLVTSIAFSFYVARFGSYNETYGTLGAIVVTLLWMYISALVVIVGAEINAEMEHQTAQDTTASPELPMGQRDAHVADTLGESA